ncbi:bifunctional serine/threonine-protein kinase/formylglycine-generating enzyme family protein [Alteromonas sp. ASW11-130]|uniref:bifunctional serine/threonine-protein kinase/formylglycine-generating enzyme family protein n=1 Tax=Alteromonas sp. ASW11-130 TaxID=3015775 RepID=UPI002241A266|nr:bifunctional serine/threonine-protein kinase/formylglycine-generating enzyme family protein [Alteromonas sp. ASW11-130]MCW8090308.1 protein kinase [Alteromonas sp. ASW11-130]
MQFRELELTLVKLIRENFDISRVEKVIDNYLAEAPQRAVEVYQLLNEYLDNELINVEQFTRLVKFTRKCSAAVETHTQGDTPQNSEPKASEEEQTIIAKDPDRTRIIHDADKTVFVDSDKTILFNKTSTEQEIPPNGSLRDNAVETHITSPSFTTSNSWNKPFADGQKEEQIGIGTVIKERFRLIEFIGRGGMGDVYKAEDLRRSDADDVELEVAIKLLNNEFKKHPDSLRALQREARKTQSLAHPHIVNVHDFDRDNVHVFMTMEYMDGEPLNEVLKKNALGLEYSLATKLVEELCSALQYAHRRGVIHSDLKPSNIFLTQNNEIKVFDFGIARAANIKEDGTASIDTFDAGEIGALTPTYASPEMIVGAHEPSVRDDLYALGCIVYEIYTGRHPFYHQGKKLPADEAQNLKLTPPKVKGFSKRQQAALNQTLAFQRSDRTKNVEEFVNGFLKRRTVFTPKRLLFGFAVVIISFSAVVAFFDYHDKKDTRSLLKLIKQQDEVRVTEKVQALLAMSESERDSVLKDHKVSQELKQYLRSLATKQAEDDYYESALNSLTLAQTTYPDSREIYNLKIQIRDAQKKRIKELFSELDEVLKDRETVIANHTQISKILKTLKRVEKNNKRLTNSQPLFKLQESVEYLIEEKEYIPAKNLIKSAQYIIDEFQGFGEFTSSIEALNKQVDDVFTEEKRRVRTSQLLETITLNVNSQLSDFKDYQSQLLELSEIAPAHSDVINLIKILETRIADTSSVFIENNDWQGAEDSLTPFETIIDVSIVKHIRQKIADARLQFETQLSSKINSIKDFAANAQPEKAMALFKSLDQETLSKSEQQNIADIVAQSWLNAARLQKEINNWNAAIDAINYGLSLDSPQSTRQKLENEQHQIALAQQTLQNKSNEQARLLAATSKQKKISQLENTIRKINSQPTLSLADITSIQSTLDTLAIEAPNHPLIAESKMKITEKVSEKIATGIASNELKGTLHFAENAYSAYPSLNYLGEQIDKIKNLIAKAEQRDLQEQLAQQRMNLASTIDQANKVQDFTLIEQLIADYAGKESNLQNISKIKQSAVEKLIELANRSANDLRFNQAKQFLLLGERFDMPQNDFAALTDDIQIKEALRKQQQIEQQRVSKIESLYENVIAFVQADDLMQADSTLAELKALQGITPEQQQIIDKAYALAFLKLSQEAYEKLDLTSANYWLDKARRLTPNDNQLSSLQAKFRAVSTILNSRQSNTNLAQKLKVSAMNMYPDDATIKQIEIDEKASASDNNTDIVPTKAADKLSSSNASSAVKCTPQMAGKGNVYTCRDTLTATFNGPYLIVLPSFYEQSFAITKYEIRVGEYNTYCRETELCGEVPSDRLDPITGLSIAQIENFAKWISEVTRSTYRLPTASEWRFAAKADGESKPSIMNCAGSSGSGRLASVNYEKTNTSNAWGLTNYLGNAQEVATVRKGYVALGGHYLDETSRCTVNFSRFISSETDKLTGFRLIKELD